MRPRGRPNPVLHDAVSVTAAREVAVIVAASKVILLKSSVLIIGSAGSRGGCSITSGSEGSKAKARPGNMSEMRLIQSSCIAFERITQPQIPRLPPSPGFR